MEERMWKDSIIGRMWKAIRGKETALTRMWTANSCILMYSPLYNRSCLARLTVTIGDAIAWLQEHPETYDVIIFDLPDCTKARFLYQEP